LSWFGSRAGAGAGPQITGGEPVMATRSRRLVRRSGVDWASGL